MSSSFFSVKFTPEKCSMFLSDSYRSRSVVFFYADKNTAVQIISLLNRRNLPFGYYPLFFSG